MKEPLIFRTKAFDLSVLKDQDLKQYKKDKALPFKKKKKKDQKQYKKDQDLRQYKKDQDLDLRHRRMEKVPCF